MKNENDRPSSSEYPSTVTFFSILHERKTIQPLILHISSAKRTPLCPVALFPSPSPATIPVSGEMSTGGGGGGRNKIACPLHARVLRNRSCVARGRVSLIPGRCFSPGFTRRRYVKREYLEQQAGKGFARYESSRETDRSWQLQGWATIKPAPEAYWAGCF